MMETLKTSTNYSIINSSLLSLANKNVQILQNSIGIDVFIKKDVILMCSFASQLAEMIFS